MVMSDSDDTDILLLIPPNYYLTNAEEKLLYDDINASQQRQRFINLLELEPVNLQYKEKLSKRGLTSQFEAMDLVECNNCDVIISAFTAPLCKQIDYDLPSKKKEELNNINARLSMMEEKANDGYTSGISGISSNIVQTQLASRESVGMPLPTPQYISLDTKEQHASQEINNCDKEVLSDISSISTNTVRTHFGPNKLNKERVGMVHSTPNYMSASFKEQRREKDNDNNDDKEAVITEIDKFFNDDIAYNDLYMQHRSSDDFHFVNQYQRNAFLVQSGNCSTQVNDLPTLVQTLPSEKGQVSTCYQMSKADNNLISLSEIWGKSGQVTAINTSSQSNLKEEQLRRQHLEKTVRQLQARLLEYQQRLSVAIEVDRSKDNALNNAQKENNSLNQELHYVRKSLQDAEQHKRSYDDKLETLQKELAQAVSLASKFQEKNEKLEQEISNCSRKTNESCNQYKQKIEELEIITHACKRSEELAINELHKLRDKYAKSEHLCEKIKLRCQELEKENSTLRHQKDMLQEYHQKQKARAEHLETQRKSLQESLAQSTENENTLRKKLELQQKSLKSHYQQQLENVVAQKLKEFQEQLDKTEETLKSEARDRERLIAERAVKQLELINEKNELELNLLQEKHSEEVELYRIQLANASKKISDVEMKLSLYKSKRADIAEKLHNVMETQWQKALEILTSPHNLTHTTNNDTDHESPSSDNNDTDSKGTYHTNMNKEHKSETPKSTKKENNLNFLHKQITPPIDKLQAYIELLLSKSPTDFDRLDEILALTAKAKENKDRLAKAAKRQCPSKPPWKA